jgi:uncharacterized protein involved in type VI secretion and phage assembly
MSTTDEEMAELLERLRNRFYGKYRGSVADIDDQTLRVKVKVPAVLGQVTSGWCLPCVPYAGNKVGFVFLPQAGDMVWVEFEGGDPSYPILAGCCWRKDELPDDAKPKVKAIVTNAKHKLLFDDDAETITISDQNENKVSFESGGIGLERGGQKVKVSDSSVDVNDGALQVN